MRLTFNSMVRNQKKSVLLAVFLFFLMILIYLFMPGPELFVYVDMKEYAKDIAGKDFSSRKMAIVVPFRDRWTHLESFVPRMHSFLERQGVKHEFFILNHVDKHRFNRAAVINVGFLESRKCCDDMLVHDVDLVPRDPELLYRHVLPGPYHVTAPEIHPKWHYHDYVGGAMLFSDGQFKKIDGMSNNFWGWGGEDDEMFERFKESGMKVYRPTGLKPLKPGDTFDHIHNESTKAKETRDANYYFNQKIIMYRRDRRTGLHNVRYKLDGQSLHSTSSYGAPVHILNVSLECEIDTTPWCVSPDMLTEEQRQRFAWRKMFIYEVFSWLRYKWTGSI